ncbi:hypothetical protein GUJ93_ZPchr0002g24902 [Zizania palustris]|uniref:Uncharacterized protein n=1 Tax=Zizania palustris TaxID=103762 RepID=A0A8J5S1L5_ZIZPA|nr:hypothetical protein GUJ93_ZPchr0002g24902 [Zizania palustris]
MDDPLDRELLSPLPPLLSPSPPPSLLPPSPPPSLLPPSPPPSLLPPSPPLSLPSSPTPPLPPGYDDDRSLGHYKRGRSPEGHYKPPPLGSSSSPSRPELLGDRLEGHALHARSRSTSPTPRSIWRRLSPASPPRWSPSPVPQKRPCLDYMVGGRSPQRGGR